ncbi:ABC transporter permease [Bombilactobacillus bombi]|uniref:ABC transporter permease n=1 Tax=Bombilactobacillus bombi TaxID=1303590 RepID=UPI000E56DE4B|nr:ABC transporter permease [Bombilactobacillus bombi]AXX64498.1 ABC transporter permease [Bombilactobacillus bombi]
MITLIKQESYKLLKRPSTKFFVLFMIIFQAIIGFYAKNYPKNIAPKEAFMDNFYASVLIAIFLISLGSTIITNEVQYGTLKTLLYRKYSYNQILISKWITLFLYAVSLYIISIFSSWLIKISFLGRQFQLTDHINKTQYVWQSWQATNISEFLTLVFLMSFVLLLATMFNNSTPAIIVGIMVYFAASIFSQLMYMLLDKIQWLKWSPINMMNLGAQLDNNHLERLTHLNLSTLTSGYLLYMIIFLLLGVVIFRKRNS